MPGERTYIVLLEVYKDACPLNEREREDAFVSMLRSFGAWWTYFSHTHIIKTNLSISLMYEKLRDTIADQDRFLIYELDPSGQRQGWMEADAWDWLRRKAPKGKDD